MQRFLADSMRRQVGWFVLIGLGTLVLALIVISFRTDVFAKKFYLSLSPESATSFYEGQPVKFQGFTIGRVADIELLEHGKVNISLRLLDRYRSMLHQEATAQLTKEGLIGEQIVAVTAGNANLPLLRDGDAIDYETEASLEQLLSDLKPAVANADVLLRELAQLAVWLNDPYGSFRTTMTGLGDAAGGLKGERVGQAIDRLNAALAHIETVAGGMAKTDVAGKLSTSLGSLSVVMKNIEPMSEELRTQGPEMVKHLQELSASLRTVSADLEEMTPELPGLARETRKAVQQVESILDGLQGSWLFGSDPVEPDEDAQVAGPALDMQP